MREVVRVKPGGIVVVNEVYSHGITEKVRRNAFVDRVLYPKLQSFVYSTPRPYITEHERKLNERELSVVEQAFYNVISRQYFYLIVKRLMPEKSDAICRLDRRLLKLSGPLGRLLAGRVLVVGSVRH